MAGSQGKMSLVAQFDDLCRYSAILNEGCEKDFLQFVRLVQHWRKQWSNKDNSFNDLKTEHSATLLELNEWKMNYENQNRKLRDETTKRIRAESRLIELQNIFGEVKEVVNRDDTITHQTKERFMQWTRYDPIITAHIEQVEQNEQSGFYDKTEDDLDLQDDNSTEIRLGKRRSGPRKSGSTPPKRQKSGEVIYTTIGQNNTLVATTTVNVPSNGDIIASSRIETYSKGHQRCNSEPDPAFNPSTPSVVQNFQPNFQSNRGISTSSLPDGTPKRTPQQQKSSTSLRSHLSNSKLNTRQHNFVSKTVIRPESCLPCGRRIKFYKEAMKCVDCRAAAHPECQNMVPLPCVPCTQTPKNRGERLTVADFAPRIPPMVPALIIYCVNEIEKRCMNEVGLYRVPGSEREVRELKEIFQKGKGMPNLSKVDVNVLCGVIKDFLRNIETLIPRTLWQDFIKASEIDDAQDSLTSLYQSISQLPQANRDTLAYLILHLQRISETPEIKMGVHNIATVLGPTFVGYSSANLQPEQLMSEQRKQCKVMENLLRISSDYWSTFVSADNENLFSSISSRTPDNKTPEQSLLGPLRSGSFQSLSRSTVGKTPLSSRVPQESMRRPFKQKFFASPKLN